MIADQRISGSAGVYRSGPRPVRHNHSAGLELRPDSLVLAQDSLLNKLLENLENYQY